MVIDVNNKEQKIGRKINYFILTGWVRSELKPKISVNQKRYITTLVEVEELRKDDENENNIEEQIEEMSSGDSVRVIFWEDDFPSNYESVVSQLKEGQSITARGHFTGQENSLFRIKKLIDTDSLLLL